jgi:hypothetical protein
MKTDEICERYAQARVGLTLRLLAEDDGASPSAVLIEGPSRALRMLAELLVATADECESDGFSISPFGAGKDHFSKASELGIYIHRVPEGDNKEGG